MCAQRLGCFKKFFLTSSEASWIFLAGTGIFSHEHYTPQEICKIKCDSRAKHFIGKVTFHNNGIINAEGRKAKCKCWNAFTSAFVPLLQLMECHLFVWVHSVKQLESITSLGKWASSTPSSSELVLSIYCYSAASSCCWSINIMKELEWMIDRTVCYFQQESEKSVKRLVSKS